MISRSNSCIYVYMLYMYAIVYIQLYINMLVHVVYEASVHLILYGIMCMCQYMIVSVNV